jgi:hypothetical protein
MHREQGRLDERRTAENRRWSARERGEPSGSLRASTAATVGDAGRTLRVGTLRVGGRRFKWDETEPSVASAQGVCYPTAHVVLITLRLLPRSAAPPAIEFRPTESSGVGWPRPRVMLLTLLSNGYIPGQRPIEVPSTAGKAGKLLARSREKFKVSSPSRGAIL